MQHSQNLTYIYGLGIGTILASALGMSMMLNQDNQTIPSASRKEEIEGTDAEIISSEETVSQPLNPALAR